MTANHAHTLKTAQVRFAATFPNENFSLKGTDFDRWLAERDARIIAAAEQRGAERAFRKTQEIIAGFDHMYREYDDMINTDYLIQEIDTEIQDLMESDDGTH